LERKKKEIKSGTPYTGAIKKCIDDAIASYKNEQEKEAKREQNGN